MLRSAPIRIRFVCTTEQKGLGANLDLMAFKSESSKGVDQTLSQTAISKRSFVSQTPVLNLES